MHPSPQLVDYLSSPSNGDHYTSIQGTAGQDAVRSRQKNMKEFLEGWEKSWEEIPADEELVKVDVCRRQKRRLPD